jgi:hypothetical protein
VFGSHAVGDPRRWDRSLRWVLAPATAVWALCGCSTILQAFHGQNRATATKRADQLQVLQFTVMRFADEYAGGVIEPVQRLQAETQSALDMMVLATLSRMVVEDDKVSEQFGERATPLRDAHRRLEALARDLAKDVITPDQFAQLQRVIDEWRERNPHVRAVSYVHFRDFAKSIGRPKPDENVSPGGLFAVLGIDPLSTLDPAVRELAQSRELAERTIYYAQRMPSLIDMQVERLTDQFATTPETKRLLANVDRAAGAAEATGHVVGELAGVLTRERQAAIRQFMEAVTVETAHTRELVIELRGTLEAGTVTSNALTTSIRSLDQLLAAFDKPKPAGGPPEKPGRPFDVTEYTAAAVELTRAANELQQLVVGVERDSPTLVQAADHAAGRLRNVVDHAYRRMVQLIGLLLLGGLFVAVAYRSIARRWLA